MPKRGIAIAAAAWLLWAGPALAQQLTEQMTCQQAIDTFAANGVVYTTVHGSALPIRRGVPIAEARGMRCGGRNGGRFNTSVPTSDKRRCVIAAYCG